MTCRRPRLDVARRAHPWPRTWCTYRRSQYERYSLAVTSDGKVGPSGVVLKLYDLSPAAKATMCPVFCTGEEGGCISLSSTALFYITRQINIAQNAAHGNARARQRAGRVGLDLYRKRAAGGRSLQVCTPSSPPATGSRPRLRSCGAPVLPIDPAAALEHALDLLLVGRRDKSSSFQGRPAASSRGHGERPRG